MKKIVWIVVLVLLLAAAGAWYFSRHIDGITSSASISRDDSLICYVNAKGKTKSIYVIDGAGTKVKEIPISNDATPFNPVFSPDSQQILYLAQTEDSDTPQSALWLVDIDGGNPRCLTPGKQNITEAVFSPDGKRIYFLNAGSYGHYSPIAQSHPHDFDIYSIDITGNDPKQLTDLKAYGLSDLVISNDGANLFFVKMGEDNTLYALPLASQTGPVPLLSDCWDAMVSPDSKEIAFTQMRFAAGGSNFDLHAKSFDFDKLTFSEPRQITFFQNRVFGIRFFNRRPSVLFVEQTNWPETSWPQCRLMEVNLDGSDLKQINLPK
jgi:dipeptidyl aminopeptidase/acylaminoacyl peptidase